MAFPVLFLEAVPLAVLSSNMYQYLLNLHSSLLWLGKPKAELLHYELITDVTLVE